MNVAVFQSFWIQKSRADWWNIKKNINTSFELLCCFQPRLVVKLVFAREKTKLIFFKVSLIMSSSFALNRLLFIDVFFGCPLYTYVWYSDLSINLNFGGGSGPVWLGGIGCHGHESDVSFCSNVQWDNNTCNHDNDVAISCGKFLLKDNIMLIKYTKLND